MAEHRRKSRLKVKMVRQPERHHNAAMMVCHNATNGQRTNQHRAVDKFTCSFAQSGTSTSLQRRLWNKTHRTLTTIFTSSTSVVCHISASITLLVIICCTLSTLCNANEAFDSRYALRPFQASPRELTRRQDGAHHQHSPLLELQLPPVGRPPLSPNEPNLVPILTAPVPRGSNANSKPSFQRIRLNKPTSQATRQTLPPQGPEFALGHFTQNDATLSNFRRVVGINPPLQSPASLSPTSLSSPALVTTQPVLPTNRQQNFRRIKPTSSSGTRRVKLKSNSPLPVLPVITASRVNLELNSQWPTMVQPTTIKNNNNQQLRGRGPVSGPDEDLLHKDNALDNDDDSLESSSFFGNRLSSVDNGADNGILMIGSLSRHPTPSSSSFTPTRTSNQSPVHTPTIPLTYYTTFTYFTTVSRGQHTATLSRELVSSSVQVRPIDRSIVNAIEFSEGYVRPSKSKVLLGTKTKGATTTIYNMASRVQVYNEDLYKVIYATRSQEAPKVSSSSRIREVLPSNRIPSNRISPTIVSSNVYSIQPTRTFSQPSLQSRQPPIKPYRLEELERQPKKYLTKYTYFYTFIDKSHTRYSTRIEETAGTFSGSLATVAPSLGNTIDSDGLLPVLTPSSATVALGSRAHGRMTTVVNLALNNYVQFDNVRNAQVQIKPTSVASISSTLATSSSSLNLIHSSLKTVENTPIFSSFDRSSELISSSVETPRLSSTLIHSSQVHSINPTSTTRSTESSTRSSASRRPIRVKVKPIRSKISSQLLRVSSRTSLSPSAPLSSPSSTSSAVLLASSNTVELSSSLVLSSLHSSVNSVPLSSSLKPSFTLPLSSVKDSSTLSSPILSTPSVSRKKVTYTLRRAGSSGFSRYFSRRPSSYLVRSSSVLVSSPSPVDILSSIEPYSPVFLSSSVLPSSDFSSSIFSSSVHLTPSYDTLIPSSTVSPLSSLSPVIFSYSTVHSSLPIEPAQSSSLWKPSKPSTKSRLVKLTRLPGAINKWNPLYASRIRVSSRKILKSTNLADLVSSNMIEPSSVVETIYETTTHTVPFTLGSTTIYTTVEETNSRVVTRQEDTIESSMMSPSFDLNNQPGISSSMLYPSTVSFETSTQLTTVTHFNTIYNLDSSIVSSSKQILSSIFTVPKLAPASSTVIVETSDVFTTSTLYSTYTYFATLFNGSQTMITPLEEVKTEYLTLREPTIITRTIMPTMTMVPVSPSSAIRSVISSSEMSSAEQEQPSSFLTETLSTHTTLTHFITLFSGSRTILSSIEEISPTVITQTRVAPTTVLIDHSTIQMSSQLPMPSVDYEKIPEPVHSTYSSSIMPSVSTPLEPSLESSSRTVTSSISTISSSDVSSVSSKTISEITPSLKQLSDLFVLYPVTTPTWITSTTSSSIDDKPDQLETPVLAVLIEPSTTLLDVQHSSSTTAVIKPGSVIELTDLLEGVQDAGEIGETIKDIVNNIVINNGTQSEAEKADTTTVGSVEESSRPPVTDAPVTMLDIVTTLNPSFSSTPINSKTTPSLNSIKNRYPTYVASQNLPKYYVSSSEDKSNLVIFSTQSEGEQSELPLSTRYVTSIEKSIKTLTLTSTKVYYTRDSPLTITSVLTTTLPPITYVSTIIGSKTILGTYNSITPTKTITLDTTSTNTVTSSTILPPTTRPRLYRPKNQEPKLSVAKVMPFLNSKKTTNTSNSNNKPSTVTQPPLMRNTTLGLEMCSPSCNMTNKEYCIENESGKYTCECRPGYVRKPVENVCQEIKNYLVVVRVSKTAESEVAATSFSPDGELISYNRVARRQVGKADGIAGLQVLSVDRTASNSHSPVVNMTIQVDHAMSNMQEDLSRKLRPLGQVEKIVDFDECSSPLHNDCSNRARCINEPGSYRCQCLDNYIDLDPLLPGRLCVSELKSCDYCYGRGDCWRHQSSTVCRCHPMFIGRRCEINGLLLAILVPIVAILVIVAIVCFLYCSRKLRQRNRRFKNLAAYGPVAVIGGTLDRKAMLETSSESSDPQHRSSHYTSESNPASARGSMARRNSSRRESEPSLDRSLASYSATGSAYNSLPPQILIPRARPPYTIHPGQVYMW